jgi:SCY1-like protein 1
MALSATSEFYEPEDIATKIIPSIAHLLIDKEKYFPPVTATNQRIVRVQATKTMESFLVRIAKLTTSMADTALSTPVETPRSLTPSQPSENIAFTAGSALAGWAISGLKKQVLGAELNGDGRPESAPPSQSRFKLETPNELRGLGSEGDVDAWNDEVFDEEGTKSWVRQKSAPESQGQRVGMKLPVKSKKSVVEQVVEEEERKSMDDAGAWPGLEDWEDDSKEDDGWGFDDD